MRVVLALAAAVFVSGCTSKGDSSGEVVALQQLNLQQPEVPGTGDVALVSVEITNTGVQPITGFKLKSVYNFQAHLKKAHLPDPTGETLMPGHPTEFRGMLVPGEWPPMEIQATSDKGPVRIQLAGVTLREGGRWRPSKSGLHVVVELTDRGPKDGAAIVNVLNQGQRVTNLRLTAVARGRRIPIISMHPFNHPGIAKKHNSQTEPEPMDLGAHDKGEIAFCQMDLAIDDPLEVQFVEGFADEGPVGVEFRLSKELQHRARQLGR